MNAEHILIVGIYFFFGLLAYKLEKTRELVKRLDKASFENAIDLHKSIIKLSEQVNKLERTSDKHSGML